MLTTQTLNMCRRLVREEYAESAARLAVAEQLGFTVTEVDKRKHKEILDSFIELYTEGS